MKIGSVCMICLVAGVALSVFEYVLQIGATQSNMGGKKALRIAAVYSGIQLLLLLGGTLASRARFEMPDRICHSNGCGGRCW